MTKIFIGLPVYNGENFIESAIESLLAQTHKDFEVLISDNASSDRTEEIGRNYASQEPRIRYVRHKQNFGAAPNFNFCVEEAHGKYFKWMAHDDHCAPEYLEKCVALLEIDPGAVLCHARALQIDDAQRIGGIYDREWDFNDPDPVVRFARVIALDHACVTIFGVMRLEVLRRTPAIAPFVGSDRSLLGELALHGRLEYVPEPLFHWREHRARSVRINRRERVAWFHSGVRVATSMLHSQQLIAAQGAIQRSPLPSSIKRRAYWQLLRWSVVNWHIFDQDLRSLVGSLVRLALGRY